MKSAEFQGCDFLISAFQGGSIIDTLLLLIAGTAAISCLVGAVAYLISISNEMVDADIEDMKAVK